MFHTKGIKTLETTGTFTPRPLASAMSRTGTPSTATA
jgi:hypothetical protein